MTNRSKRVSLRLEVKVRDVLIGIVFLAIISALIVVTVRRAKIAPKLQLLPSLTPAPTSSVEENIERKFNVTIPSGVEKAELKDITGGTGEGVATREKEGTLNVYTILANLENPPANQNYYGWLERGKKGEANYAAVSLGKLRMAKGGWLGEFSTKTDYSDYKNVAVTLESKTPTKPGKYILEGSF